MADAGDCAIAQNTSFYAKHIVWFQRTARIAYFNAVVIADNLCELTMTVVTMHEHVNQCFTHYLHRKCLYFRLN